MGSEGLFIRETVLKVSRFYFRTEILQKARVETGKTVLYEVYPGVETFRGGLRFVDPWGTKTGEAFYGMKKYPGGSSNISQRLYEYFIPCQTTITVCRRKRCFYISP